jgi:major intracellular serine protease
MIKVNDFQVVAKAAALDMNQLGFLTLSGREAYYAQGIYGQGVIVAVLDTGANPHPEFEDRLIFGDTFCTDYKASEHMDDFGHGNHVIGSVAGKNVGVAPKAKVLSVKVMNNMGEGYIQDIVNGLQYILRWRSPEGKRVDIVNMSITCSGTWLEAQPALYAAYHAAVKALVDAGIIVICASGNTGDGTILYPACWEEPITVGAVDIGKKLAYFSTQTKEVDVCQVGVNVLSCGRSNDYMILSGTSMASPLTSGIAALAVCKYKLLNSGKYMPEPELFAFLKMSTCDLGIPGTDISYGAGFCTLAAGFHKKQTRIDFKQGDCNISVNGQVFVSDVPVTVQMPANSTNGRTMVPMRIFSEQLGCMVLYDNSTKVASLIKDEWEVET